MLFKKLPLRAVLAGILLMAGLVLSQAGNGAAAQSAPTVKSGQTNLGEILTGPDGRTLYVFTKDTAGVSNCTGACLQNWPPLTVAARPNASRRHRTGPDPGDNRAD